ncbi:MAG: hypothetical protein HY303_17235, partial [Candidatus Wallbacteria bacterium]|nr:hypothetical protein [Candidatus Wallbacteria bacterium]
MRLICGLVRFDGDSVSPELLETMAKALVSPGLAPALRLGGDRQCGLAVLDFPAVSEGATLALPRGPSGSVLAADVRLDAADELRRTLGQSEADEESLMLSALERWSDGAGAQLLGDFAFACWNAKTQTLLCGRDVFGVRPFAYVHRPGVLFAFASFPRGLHPAIVDRRLDEAALGRKVLRLSLADETLIREIRRLPAAHDLEVTANRATLRRYWRLDDATAGKSQVSPEEAARELRARLERAVTSRLPATGPVAAHLSGGLDSSSVSVFAARELRRRNRTLHVFSLRAQRPEDYPADDESPYVQSVLAQEPDMAWTPVFPPSLVEVLEGRMDADGPLLLDPEPPDAVLCRLAAQQGCSFVLSGWGGDEGASFNGRGCLAEAFARGQWRYLASELTALAHARETSRWSVFRGNVLGYFVPDWLAELRQRLRGGPTGYRDVARQLLSASTLAGLDPGLRRHHPGPGYDAGLIRLSLLESPFTTERCENWAAFGGRHGIAFGFPMLDRRVTELAVSLQAGHFIRGGHTRRVFRDAMQGVLPDGLRWRRHKFTPIPSMAPTTPEHRDALLRRIAAAGTHPRVRELFDTEAMRSAPTKTGPTFRTLASGRGSYFVSTTA